MPLPRAMHIVTYLILLLLVVGQCRMYKVDVNVSDHQRSKPGVQNCTEKYLKQKLDHFNFPQADTQWPQRYFVYDGFVKKKGNRNDQSPIFFYGAMIT